MCNLYFVDGKSSDDGRNDDEGLKEKRKAVNEMRENIAKKAGTKRRISVTISQVPKITANEFI